MKNKLFNLLLIAFVIVMLRLWTSQSEQVTAMLTCLSVVLVAAMMRLR